jgi:hypothetical protein
MKVVFDIDEQLAFSDGLPITDCRRVLSRQMVGTPNSIRKIIMIIRLLVIEDAA